MNDIEKYNKVFDQMTTEMRELMFELLVQKYLYYELDRPLLSDFEYDKMESKWLQLMDNAGINYDEYPFFIGFPHNHPMAEEAKTKAEKLLEYES